MANAKFEIPIPPNEPMRNYLPGSPEKASLKAKLEEMQNRQIEIPLIIGGEEIKTGKIGKCVLPHDHKDRDRNLSSSRRKGSQRWRFERHSPPANHGRH